MLDNGVETWRTVPQRPRSLTSRAPLLVHIYPSGPGIGSCYALNDHPTVIGRGSDCEIRILDGSVSRRHARIDWTTEGYCVIDLQSTNGTFVNDIAVLRCKLQDGDYLRVGNCIYRFLAGDNVEAEYHEEIYRLIIIDALTEIPNKRFMLEFLERELSRSARFSRPLALLLFDLDLFKTINDDLGHLAGDYTLRELASRVREVIRKEELFARYGGEEFAVVLPETGPEEAVRVSERIRRLVENHRFQFEGKSFPVTVSLGVATTTGQPTLTAEEFIRAADGRLYEAKRQGRNRVVV
jgi:two-component system, cell cycle response regulator